MEPPAPAAVPDPAARRATPAGATHPEGERGEGREGADARPPAGGAAAPGAAAGRGAGTGVAAAPGADKAGRGGGVAAPRRAPEEIAAALQRLLLLTVSPRVEGWIFKRGGVSLGFEAFKSWKRRWFALDHISLLYWTDRDSRVGGAPPRGVYPLIGAKHRRTTVDGVPSEFTLEISWHRPASPAKLPPLLLVAASEGELHQWEAALDVVHSTLRGKLQGRSAGAVRGQLRAWEAEGISAHSVDGLRERRWNVGGLCDGGEGGPASPTASAPQQPRQRSTPPRATRLGDLEASAWDDSVLDELALASDEDDGDEPTCPSCGAAVVAAAAFCDQCGSPLR